MQTQCINCISFLYITNEYKYGYIKIKGEKSPIFTYVFYKYNSQLPSWFLKDNVNLDLVFIKYANNLQFTGI